MKIDIKTANEAYLVSMVANKENYKKSFDAIMDYLLREINKAANQGEYSIKIKLALLENFICNSNFEDVLQDVYRILTNGQIYDGEGVETFSNIGDDTRSLVIDTDGGLGYTIEVTETHWTINWSSPLNSPFDIALPEGPSNVKGAIK